MPDTVVVTIEVEPEVAAAFDDPRTRAAMARLVSRVLAPRRGPSDLARAIAEAKAEARAAGLSDADIDAELEAYNAEHHNDPIATRSSSTRPPR
jgi:hypothetical protein